MIANGWLKKAKRPVGIELGGAGGHPVGKLALRFDDAVQARCGRPRDPGCRPRSRRPRRSPAAHRRAQHAPLAADRRRLGARNGACRFQRRCAPARALSSPAASISSLPRAMTSAASRASTAATKALLTRPRLRSGPRYHIGNGALSIRWVSASSAPSVWRSLGASFEPLRLRRRWCRTATAAWCRRFEARAASAAAHFQHAARSRRSVPGARSAGRRWRRRGDIRSQGFEVLGANAGLALARSSSRSGGCSQPKVALKVGIDLDLAIGIDEQRPRRRGAQQGGGRAGAGEDGIGTGDAPRGHDQQQGRDRHPEGGENDHHGRGAGSHRCVTLPAMRRS